MRVVVAVVGVGDGAGAGSMLGDEMSPFVGQAMRKRELILLLWVHLKCDLPTDAASRH